ncbi:hypothetical protein HIM_11897 [Hirsutella minnesotensis 3608]|uniref:YCII-related domain-containing protein n=1 Tax=Hirsutella minnesotensis 3608 TaxID=1043627 RepID=A0A0F8A0P2_9HYPO|nr:hypothetical protein HIM_11897 [Hirsutella minnesotensis 3608]
MPRFMFLIKADPTAESVEAQAQFPAQIFETMTRFNEEMAHAGILLAAEGFTPTAVDGYRIRYNPGGAEPHVTKGPFDVAKEDHVCGFWLVQTKDADEALSWAKKVPFPQGEIVVRRVSECSELGDAFSADLREREGKLRVKLGENRKAAGM